MVRHCGAVQDLDTAVGDAGLELAAEVVLVREQDQSGGGQAPRWGSLNLGRARTTSPRLADVLAKQAQIGGAETIGGGLRLVPVRVEQGLGADFVQPRDLVVGELQLC